MPLSSIEHSLSYQVRRWLPHVLSTRASHRTAYVLSLLSALTSGFISLVSLYSYPWKVRLNYTSWQINTISSMASLGAYLVPPVLGILADNHGPITLSCLSIVGFIPSYSYLAYIFNHPEISQTGSSFGVVVACFVVIGISTSALYFSALLTCTKLYPQRKLLSISFPTTCIGISSLVGSQILKFKVFWYDDMSINETYLNLNVVFKCLAILYVIIGLSAWVSTGTVSMITYAEDLKQEADLLEEESDTPTDAVYDVESFEAASLLHTSRSSISISSAMLATTNYGTQKSDVATWEQPKSVFRDPTLYLLAITMLLTLGPLEMFVTDMASLSNLILDSNKTTSSNTNTQNVPSTLLSIFALSSTAARLTSGVISDYLLDHNLKLRRILLPLLVLTLVSQVLILALTESSFLKGLSVKANILISGAVLGVSYGGLFTIYPTLVLTVWGQKSFGSAYGSLMVAPALGSVVSCMQYALIYDSRCVRNVVGTCISAVYKFGTAQVLVAIVITCIMLKGWGKRGHQA
ncbi:Mch1p KNAG_0D04300 [Huiozyma naganishii CBS 8797]|uniref:Probable transporter MCH1 n=1 Tax=Huiozyma naganishii (strain ATCC MYA-139 / BCRC 22969 / CBS 8797 / KCTC 17520 / NBRC 10181 / NCYC 3082 / Yp74L-3) TaxID=1071383 RepID=J7S786_HUIN7|nr:hypothetical protein KNAG_0D04300 [Kazachstania naganishii CBS 8797]CCK70176.1 hypothetical protein KNAG_0D04300 [Kazachstania naganishii CBS 8797]